MFETRVGVGFVFGSTLIGLSRVTLVADVSNTVSEIGSVSNMPDGIGTTSSLSSLLSLSLVRRVYVLEIHGGVDIVVNFLIGLVLNVLAADVSSAVSVVGLVSNMPGEIRITLSSSLGALLTCFWLFFRDFLDGEVENSLNQFLLGLWNLEGVIILALGTSGAGGTKHDHERNQQEDQSNSSRNGGSCGNNSKDQRNEDTNKLSQFNDKRYSGKLGGDGDTADVEQLQTFCINIKSQGVLKGKVAKVLKAFSFECMNKVDGLTFNPMKNQTLPTPTPISTKEAFPTASARFLEFFNTIMTQRGVTVYYRIKSTITVMDLWHRVFYFLQENHA